MGRTPRAGPRGRRRSARPVPTRSPAAAPAAAPPPPPRPRAGRRGRPRAAGSWHRAGPAAVPSGRRATGAHPHRRRSSRRRRPSPRRSPGDRPQALRPRRSSTPRSRGRGPQRHRRRPRGPRRPLGLSPEPAFRPSTAHYSVPWRFQYCTSVVPPALLSAVPEKSIPSADTCPSTNNSYRGVIGYSVPSRPCSFEYSSQATRRMVRACDGVIALSRYSNGVPPGLCPVPGSSRRDRLPAGPR